MRGQINRNVQLAFATELVDARSSEFYKVRASGWLLLLEAGLLSLRMRSLPKDDRQRAELAAAVLAAGAAGMEVLACGTELVLRHFGAASTTGVGATVFLGRLKLWGGVLAIGGAIVTAVYDWVDANQAKAEDKRTLALAYQVRSVVAIAMAASQFGLAFAAAHPMFKILAERAPMTRTAVLYDIAARLSGYVARQAMTLALKRILLGGVWVAITVTVLIAIFDDDALEKWCKRTVYRGPKFQGGELFKDAATELGALYGALAEVL